MRVFASNLLFMWAIINAVGFTAIHNRGAACVYLGLAFFWHHVARFMERT